ncbi:nSTAND1 domain-containing NTPase [Granulicella aggregans]|uniref:nSTAND1 domain-containing NTPase n=1 Tax=Granulicella aggregans TaxID=474949 RepID=UPI0021DF9E0D|nr:restriction endonuclease [Granulicella aggregans]
MIKQVQIIPDPSATQQSKGDFFENLLRSVMETQRYKVVQRVNFTGSEIDLLCEHLDRPADTALVECKARTSIDSGDIKNFSFNVLVAKHAKYGFFVHTTELQHQAAGLVPTIKHKNLIFWGPDKVCELLQHARLVGPAPSHAAPAGMTPTKLILLYSYLGRFWITILSDTVVPTHYHVTPASGGELSADAARFIADLDDVRGLDKVEEQSVEIAKTFAAPLDAVAEIQEAEQWDDYRPVGSKFFIGRKDVRHHLYSFLHTPLESTSARRVFFIESKSGWGKSSLIAELRARSRNKRNKHWLHVMAVDSRSANTGAFVGMAFAKMVASAAKSGFVPPQFSRANVASNYDVLASPEARALLDWLSENRKVLVLVFDQFEDMFRKADLFQAFHKFMLDVNAESGNLIVGFSWKSEINVPIDNPAYSLWQQARDLAEPFGVDAMLDSEINLVLRQLEDESGHAVPFDLRRKLSESSQGFPWLIKRLSIHCYHQLRKGIRPDELVDQNLNVDELMKEDEEILSPDEIRALRYIAKRGYEGDPFDAAEIDEKVSEQVIQQLQLNRRLIVKSGTKYNVYWDIFRDYLVEGKIRPIGESFLLRQFPTPCVKTLKFLLGRRTASLDEILAGSPGLSEGTALNRLRELRYLGAVTKAQDEDRYTIRPTIQSEDDFKAFMRGRLQEHILARTLARIEGDTISHEDVVEALSLAFKRYSFRAKTWRTYASYFIAWFRYAGVDFGRRLRLLPKRPAGAAVFIPQWRPEKDYEVLLRFKNLGRILRTKDLEKPLYDLRALGLIENDGPDAALTKRGSSLLQIEEKGLRAQIALVALGLPKVRLASEAWMLDRTGAGKGFEAAIAPALNSIPSKSYRNVAKAVLKTWGRFIVEELNPRVL